MKALRIWTCATLALASAAIHAEQPGPKAKEDQANLFQTVTALNTEFFGAFNRCDVAGQLEKHASLMDTNVEFYHDKGGVSWTRKDYIDKTRQNVCGHYRRKLIPGTMEVYPIEGFGAIEEGQQDFCDLRSDTCFGQAKFMIVWHRTPDGWRATRIFSYGHRALDDAGARPGSAPPASPGH
ncbi:nuclear transport factor 2 family protein [Luteibacter sp. CQ10]|uniref:nuclear transport factor 2 family protein n=1 Tax=Luteibacter sp. CQ10 TaxID=2805821 RepID=UPI0034A1113E